jgi:hypothetical protein
MTDPTRQYATYRHYKGGIYIKMAEAMHTETGEPLTVYICALSGMVFCRPTASFTDMVNTPDYQGPRFIALPDNTTKAQRKSL